MAMAAVTLLWSGCATQDIQQFEPIPRAQVGTATLEPVDTRPVIELLREADREFQKANMAQEAGDSDGALRHYTAMLELLIRADLDPGIFYSLRGEFESVIDTSKQHASVFDGRERRRLMAEDLRGLGGYGEIPIPFPLPEAVLHQIDRIQNRYPKNFQQGLDRMQRYAPYIRAQLREAGMPQDLIYVAMIESLFTPKIVSRAGAGGMWQFMPATARRFNLRMDSHVDERYNWKSSTHAALEYLRNLYAFFDGDWSLAISAYNMGEGGLDRAMASVGGERDIWKLYVTPPASERIKQETKEYYPKFLATLIVANNPERYGFRINPIAPEETIRVPVDGAYALAELNRAMDLGSGTLESLNPDLIRQVTPASGAYPIAVPAGKQETLMAALQTLKTVRATGGAVQMASAPARDGAGSVHTVRRGETLSRIATRYGVSTGDLMKANSIRSANHIHSGQKLRIPGGGAPQPATIQPPATGGTPGNTAPASAPAQPPSAVAVAAARSYKVRTGDTLYDIARKHDVTVSELQAWNGMGRSAQLLVGKTLHVQDPKKPYASLGDGQYHEVRAGDYPARIAKAYNMPLDQLLALNNLSANDTIRIGDKLVVAKGNPAAVYAGKDPTPADAKATHTVTRGDTASTIAQRYGVSTRELLAWNDLGSRSVLRIGDKLVVYTGEGSGPAPGAQNRDDDGLDKIIHTVARGHNPTTIARRYGVSVTDLFRWNNWPKNKTLHVGDEVVVYKAR